MMHELVEVRLKREYGPFLDGRANLPPGRYRALLTGWETYTKKPSSFDIAYNGSTYYIQAKDVEIVEVSAPVQ
jgi:hypothetical protein